MFSLQTHTPAEGDKLQKHLMNQYNLNIRLIIDVLGKKILFTGDVDFNDKEKCMEAGCDFYISKPIGLELLINTLGCYLIYNHELVMPS